jgi:hypothetical protein
MLWPEVQFGREPAVRSSSCLDKKRNSERQRIS